MHDLLRPGYGPRALRLRIFRLAFALCAPQLIPFTGEWDGLSEMLRNWVPDPRALVLVPAFWVLACYLGFLTALLDGRCSWQEDFSVRMVWQYLLGLGLPALLNLLLIFFFIPVSGLPAAGRLFWEAEFHVALWSMLILNMPYRYLLFKG